MHRVNYIKENFANDILNTVGAIILAMDKDGRIVLFNRAAEELTGYTFEDVKDKTPWDFFILPEEAARVREVFSHLSSGDFPNTNINYWLTRTGEKRLIDWSNTAMLDDDGNLQYIIATGVDITRQRAAEDEVKNYQKNLEDRIASRTHELERMNAQLKKVSRLDPTTGIFNRRHFDEVIDLEVRRCKRKKDYLSLLMIDIDYFKKFNDTYGHLAGDTCLKDVAKILNKNLKRSTDIVTRYGGEEFVIILPGSDSEQAMKTAEKLLIAVRKKGIENKKSPNSGIVTISIGVATCIPQSQSTSADIIACADKALYVAKSSGRNMAQQYKDTTT